MRNNNILYLLHVSWFWIKQRPQFLAEEISRYFPVTVACLEDYNNKKTIRESDGTGRLTLKSFWIWKFAFPGDSIKGHLNFWLKKWQLRKLIKQNEILWFSSPVQFLYAKNYIEKNQFVIYDCMDDIAEFYNNGKVKDRLRELEHGLCNRCNLIITSATVLKDRLSTRYNIDCPVEVVNNGMSNSKKETPENLPPEIVSIFEDRSKKNLVYIGTISDWFDFEEMILMLNKYPAIQLVMVGPNESKLPTHSQIIYTGKVPHSQVDTLMNLSDALIMPFKITELVKAVNPVKAYEYISSGKPVILSYYEETEYFNDFAYLYKNSAELSDYLYLLTINKLNPKNESKACLEFANKNTWSKRALRISEFINVNKARIH